MRCIVGYGSYVPKVASLPSPSLMIPMGFPTDFRKFLNFLRMSLFRQVLFQGAAFLVFFSAPTWAGVISSYLHSFLLVWILACSTSCFSSSILDYHAVPYSAKTSDPTVSVDASLSTSSELSLRTAHDASQNNTRLFQFIILSGNPL
jgi:hypothetical protein